MTKRMHEFRDPIHVFVRLDGAERRVLSSTAVQRLREIHQLSMTYLVYPGATHRRFEHSLGVVELATRIFDVVTHPDNRHPACEAVFPDDDAMRYWRRVLRMAALCHDVGHLPFSHAAEKRLLPEGCNHELLTVALIESGELEEVWDSVDPPLRARDIAKLAVGPKELKGQEFTVWEAVLSNIIVGDALGADRMDYLLRDSLHAGVAYGRFDHHRLVDTIRLLPKSDDDSQEPTLGVESGGLLSAEALLLARYFMFMQVYLHRVRRAYDLHLCEFLEQALPGGRYPSEPHEHLNWTDSEVLVMIRQALGDKAAKGHDAARRIGRREHFRLLYEPTPAELRLNPDASGAVFDEACQEFGADMLRHDRVPPKAAVGTDFPVQRDDGIVSSWTLSETLKTIPPPAVDFVLVEPGLQREAVSWLKSRRADLVGRAEMEEEE